MNERLERQVLRYQVQSVYAQLHDQRNRVEALLGKIVVWEKSVLRPLADQLHDDERRQA
jgi:hypothetical protein